MAASLTIEEAQGTHVGSAHPHNGYYAGDFSWLRHRNEPPRTAQALVVTRAL